MLVKHLPSLSGKADCHSGCSQVLPEQLRLTPVASRVGLLLGCRHMKGSIKDLRKVSGESPLLDLQEVGSTDQEVPLSTSTGAQCQNEGSCSVGLVNPLPVSLHLAMDQAMTSNDVLLSHFWIKVFSRSVSLHECIRGF